MSSTSILVADDDPTLYPLLTVCLKPAEFIVHQASNGRAVMQFLEHTIPDLIILDLAMPLINGFELCARIRKRNFQGPIMVLSALTQTEHIVRALEAGADDYVTKPFKPAEFAARVRALLRRSERSEWVASLRPVALEGMTIDPAAYQVFIDGIRIHFTRTEIEILLALADPPDTILTVNQLLMKVWGAKFRGSDHYLYVYLSRIRQKMGDKYGKLLETRSKLGYMLHSSFQN